MVGHVSSVGDSSRSERLELFASRAFWPNESPEGGAHATPGAGRTRPGWFLNRRAGIQLVREPISKSQGVERKSSSDADSVVRSGDRGDHDVAGADGCDGRAGGSCGRTLIVKTRDGIQRRSTRRAAQIVETTPSHAAAGPANNDGRNARAGVFRIPDFRHAAIRVARHSCSRVGISLVVGDPGDRRAKRGVVTDYHARISVDDGTACCAPL